MRRGDTKLPPTWSLYPNGEVGNKDPMHDILLGVGQCSGAETRWGVETSWAGPWVSLLFFSIGSGCRSLSPPQLRRLLPQGLLFPAPVIPHAAYGEAYHFLMDPPRPAG